MEMKFNDGYPWVRTITLENRWFDIKIDSGELLFPVVVLIFCGAYYLETRGLPAQSMLYAGPLLYVTSIMAIITVFGHAISINIRAGKDSHGSSTASASSVIWGAENTIAKQEHPKKDIQAEKHGTNKEGAEVKSTEPKPFFNVRSALGLIFFTTGYILSLYFVPFVFATAPFLAMAVYLFGERDYVRLIVYSIGFTVLLWFVFINWLRVPLP